MKVTLSIIIPVYNAARFLGRFVEGMRGWDCEIVLVDDGSVDGSAELCDGLARDDERVRVIHQANQGPSAARNAGLTAATGEWVCFFDADDAVDSSFFEFFEKNVRECDADLFVCGFRVDCGDAVERIAVANERYARVDFGKYIVDEIIAKRYGNGFLWNKVYRRAIAQSVGFDVGLRMMEDEVFNQQYLRKCATVVCCDEAFYTYRISTGANSRGRFMRSYFDGVQRVYGGFRALAAEFPCSVPERERFFEDALMERTARGVYFALSFNLFHPDSPRSECKNMLREITESGTYKAVKGWGGRSRELQLYMALAEHSLTALGCAVALFQALRKIKKSIA